MNIYLYPKGARDAVAGFEAFRRLGFEPDDIYIEAARSANHAGTWALHATLRTQDRVFRIICAVFDSERECNAELALVREMTVHINAGTFTEASAQKSYFEAMERWGGGTALVTSLQSKGFTLPIQGRASLG